jgi:hypothetical protein
MVQARIQGALQLKSPNVKCRKVYSASPPDERVDSSSSVEECPFRPRLMALVRFFGGLVVGVALWVR